MVEETFLPGNKVSLVARMHGVAPNQLFGWRRQAASGALTATRARSEVVPATECRALENQVRALQRMLGKKTMEKEILREAISRMAGPKKNAVAHSLIAGGRPVSAVAHGRRLRRKSFRLAMRADRVHPCVRPMCAAPNGCWP